MKIQETFDNEAQIYEVTSRAVTHYFDEALDTLVDNIKIKNKNPIILDVCCGTCILSEKVAKKYPQAKFYGVDFSTQMLKIGQERMKNYDFTPLIGDICHEETMKSLEMVDLIITSFGIHNVHGFEQKQLALNNIMHHLKSGGLFINCDYLKGKDKKEQELFDKFQKDWLLKTYTLTETQEWIDLLAQEDDPETLKDNFLLCENSGCHHIKLIWNKEFLAVYSATKK